MPFLIPRNVQGISVVPLGLENVLNLGHSLNVLNLGHPKICPKFRTFGKCPKCSFRHLGESLNEINPQVFYREWCFFATFRYTVKCGTTGGFFFYFKVNP